MKTINEHIKNKDLKQFYLLYGKDRALKLLFRDRLKEAICPEDDGLNINIFTGDKIDFTEVREVAQTLPFFADRRVIIIEDSGWFFKANSYLDAIKETPDTTYFIFVESSVKSNTKLFKFVSQNGYATEISTPGERDLMLRANKMLRDAGKSITTEAMEYLVHQSGTDYAMFLSEMEKLLCYAQDIDNIGLDDVKTIITYHAEDKVFEMIDAIGELNQDKAVRLYYDMLELEKKPREILGALSSSINKLLLVSSAQDSNYSNRELASMIGSYDSYVAKYKRQLRNFSRAQLLGMMDAIQQLQTDIVKKGVDDQLGLELLIIDFSRKR